MQACTHTHICNSLRYVIAYKTLREVSNIFLKCFVLNVYLKHKASSIIPYVAKCWWGKILLNLANCSYVTKINPTKILRLKTKIIAPVIIIGYKHGRLVEILSL